MSQLITQYPLPIFSIISIGIFLTLFGVITFSVLRLSKEAIDARANIPFQDNISNPIQGEAKS